MGRIGEDSVNPGCGYVLGCDAGLAGKGWRESQLLWQRVRGSGEWDGLYFWYCDTTVAAECMAAYLKNILNTTNEPGCFLTPDSPPIK